METNIKNPRFLFLPVFRQLNKELAHHKEQRVSSAASSFLERPFSWSRGSMSHMQSIEGQSPCGRTLTLRHPAQGLCTQGVVLWSSTAIINDMVLMACVSTPTLLNIENVIIPLYRCDNWDSESLIQHHLAARTGTWTRVSLTIKPMFPITTSFSFTLWLTVGFAFFCWIQYSIIYTPCSRPSLMSGAPLSQPRLKPAQTMQRHVVLTS